MVEPQPAQREPGEPALENPRRLGARGHERHPDDVLAGGRRHHDLEVRVGVDRHVLLPRRVSPDGAEEGVGRGVPEAVGAADGEPPHQPAVEADLDLLLGAHAHDVVVDHPAQPELHAILAVEREVMPDRQSPAGPERQVLAHAVVLVEQPRRRVGGGGEPGADGRIADREAADPVGGRQITVEQRRRHREGLGVGAEPLLAHVVGRKQQPALVDLEIEEAAHGVAVFGGGQAAHGGPAGVGALGRDGVEPALEPAQEPLVEVGRGSRSAGRRHHAEPQLADDGLPHIGVVADGAGVEPVEGHRHQPARLPGRRVAGEAVPLDQGPGGIGVVRGRSPSRALSRQRHRCQECERDSPHSRLPVGRRRPRQHHVSPPTGGENHPQAPASASATVVPAAPVGNRNLSPEAARS